MANTYKQNLNIINNGVVRNATKLPVITIGLGIVRDLTDLEGVIWHDEDGNVVIVTKENPDGITYNQDRTIVVRVIGGKVIIDGHYDIYCPAPAKVDRLLSNPFAIIDLPEHVLAELKPILDAASELRPSIAPAEPGRKVVVVTKDMLGDADHLVCELPLSWSDGKPTYTDLYEGDIFLVEDLETGKGYRIGKQEFAETHKLA